MKVNDRRHTALPANVTALPNRDEVVKKVVHPTVCAHCGHDQFRIYRTTAHLASKHGGLRIDCAECANVILEQA